MKIRRLEIAGFKSFADRTVLRFGEGITGVVGPNGCGKSNIVDAIRWVMGEQSAKTLRGAGMQDVIFAGSECRGPSGMAEVTLSFKNDGRDVLPEYQAYDEISVTRRLFRDGTSQYAVNKVTCRLRDVLDLFMGTGIGKNAYSIIEQGRIGLIVTAKPDDRRAIIEDAAGVSRYKARRKQAERRIASTEQNLLRITDLTEELEGRLKTLERQAKRAERYIRIKGELKGLELHNAAHRTLELLALERYEDGVHQRVAAQTETEEAQITEEETRIGSDRGRLAETDDALRSEETSFAELKQALALATNDAEYQARAREAVAARMTEAEAERTERVAELEVLERDLAEAAAHCEALQASDGAETQDLDARTTDLGELEIELDAAIDARETDKQRLADLIATVAQHENAVTNLERAKADLESQVGQRVANSKAAAERASAAEHGAVEVERALASNRQLKLSLEDERGAKTELRANVASELAVLETELDRSKSLLLDRRHRLSSLLEIQKNYEGCTDAVRRIMREKDGDSHMGASLHGLVADVLTAEPRFEAAVEAVLGDRLQYVIVNSQNDGVRSIEYLKEHAHGRSSFIPLDLREDHVSWRPRNITSRPPAEADGQNGEVGDRLLPPWPTVVQDLPTVRPTPLDADDAVSECPVPEPELREPEPVYADASGAAFSTVQPSPVEPAYLPPPPPGERFEALWEPLDLWPDLHAPGVVGKMVDLVAAQPGYEHVVRVLLGDVVIVENLKQARKVWKANGHLKTLVTLSGDVLDPVGVLTGGSIEGRMAGMLAQKREIKELTEEVRRLEGKVQIAVDRHGTLKRRLQELDRAIAELSDQRHNEELSIVTLERDLKRLVEEGTREREALRVIGEDVEMLRRKRDALAEEAQTSREAIRGAKKNREKVTAEVSERSEAAAALKERVVALRTEVTELKVQVAANRERRESSRQQVEGLRGRVEDTQGRIARLTEVVEKSGVDLTELSARIQDNRVRAEELETKVEVEQARLERARTEIERRKSELLAEDKRVRVRRDALDGLKRQATESALRIQRHGLARESLAEQVMERYRVEVSDLLVDYHLGAPLADDDRARTEKLRRQLDNIGPINLTAIDEFAEVQERYTFLSKQKRDLEDAIDTLKKAIRRINKTSKERYVEAFRLVNEKFQQVFPKLFNGGRSALVMTDESDPLESGIEILAQPPGKKLQSVSLLSGGEKALTAVALIFGIFLIKPTPFCLLDEVDAPLDEANVGRYIDMLRDISSLSQFILITHNKRTMELPDRLYGVTMEEPGISKIVPVDVREAAAS